MRARFELTCSSCCCWECWMESLKTGNGMRDLYLRDVGRMNSLAEFRLDYPAL